MQSAIYGNFSGPKAQEIIVSRGKVLELLRPDENGKMQTICSTEVFGTIRAIMPFRLTDVGRTYIVMGSDSGRIVILEYSKVRHIASHSCLKRFRLVIQRACPAWFPSAAMTWRNLQEALFAEPLTHTAGRLPMLLDLLCRKRTTSKRSIRRRLGSRAAAASCLDST